MPDIGVNAVADNKVQALRDRLAFMGWQTRLAGIELDRAEIEKRLGDLKTEEDSLLTSIAEYQKKYPAKGA